MDKFLRNNNVLRIIALCLACVLWLAVHAPADSDQQPTSTQSMTATIKFQRPIDVEVGSDMVVSSVSQPQGTIYVTVGYLRIAQLPADMLKSQLVVNAQGLGPGTQTLRVAAVNMPSDIKKYTVDPETVTVVLEKKIHQDRSVDIEVQGTPDQGTTIGTLKLSNRTVTVSGSSQQLKQVARVVGSIDVDGMKDSATKIVNLTPVDKNGNEVSGVNLSPSSISVDVPVEQSQTMVKLQPEITGQPAPGYAVSGVTLDNNQVSEIGLGKSDLPQAGLNVPVDVSGLSKSTTVNVSVPLLQGMTKVIPDTVAATVSIEPSASVTLKNVPVTVQKVPRGKQVTLPSNPTVTVTLTGPTSIVSKLSAQDVHPYVDASTLKSGDTTANVTVSVPQWVDVSSISSRSVPVQVQ